MKKFAVCSGFLGAGKTSLMIALSQWYTAHHGPAAMISNDLGGSGLADHRLARMENCRASEITGECICFCHDVLAGTLRRYFDEGCQLVLSDIPGFGVGALEHVYHGMERDYPGRFDLAPFLCVIEPERAELVCGGGDGDMIHILSAQLAEADLILLNKCDLLPPSGSERLASLLAGKYPHAAVLPVSARTGEGLEELSRILREQTASMRHPDISYGDAALQSELQGMSEYYLQYRAEVCCDTFDGSAYLLDLACQIRDSFSRTPHEIPHMKLLAWSPEGDYGKADLLGKSRPPEMPHRFTAPCRDIAAVLNATASCPPEELDRMVTRATEEVSARYQLACTVFRKQCFGMGEEGS